MTRRLASVQELQARQEALAAGRNQERPCLRVCDGTGCRALGTIARPILRVPG